MGQIYGGDFAKICGLLRIYELYPNKYLTTFFFTFPCLYLRYPQKVEISQKDFQKIQSSVRKDFYSY